MSVATGINTIFTSQTVWPVLIISGLVIVGLGRIEDRAMLERGSVSGVAMAAVVSATSDSEVQTYQSVDEGNAGDRSDIQPLSKASSLLRRVTKTDLPDRLIPQIIAADAAQGQSSGTQFISDIVADIVTGDSEAPAGLIEAFAAADATIAPPLLAFAAPTQGGGGIFVSSIPTSVAPPAANSGSSGGSGGSGEPIVTPVVPVVDVSPSVPSLTPPPAANSGSSGGSGGSGEPIVTPVVPVVDGAPSVPSLTPPPAGNSGSSGLSGDSGVPMVSPVVPAVDVAPTNPSLTPPPAANSGSSGGSGDSGMPVVPPSVLASGIAPAVPEPSSWMMLLFGFFGIGASIRNKRRGGSAQAPALRVNS